MLAQSVLHTGKSENQPHRPEAQQDNKRQRSKIGEKTFAPVRGLDTPAYAYPKAPCIFVEPRRNTEMALNAPWQNDCLKRIHQDDEDEKYPED